MSFAVYTVWSELFFKKSTRNLLCNKSDINVMTVVCCVYTMLEMRKHAEDGPAVFVVCVTSEIRTHSYHH